MPVYVLRNFVFGRRQLGLSTLSGYRLDYRSVVPAVASVGFRYRLSSPHLIFFIPPRRWSESKKPQTLRERRWLYKIHGCTCSSITSFYFHSIRHSYRSGRVNITFYFIIIFLCSRCSCVLEKVCNGSNRSHRPWAPRLSLHALGRGVILDWRHLSPPNVLFRRNSAGRYYIFKKVDDQQPYGPRFLTTREWVI